MSQPFSQFISRLKKYASENIYFYLLVISIIILRFNGVIDNQLKKTWQVSAFFVVDISINMAWNYVDLHNVHYRVVYIVCTIRVGSYF